MDELRFKDYGEFDELESKTVSLDSSDEKDEPEWKYGKVPGEEDEEEYNDTHSLDEGLCSQILALPPGI